MATKQADKIERKLDNLQKKGYQKAEVLSVEAVLRFKNQDDRSFAMQCKLNKTGETIRVVMKDDDGVMLGFMKWLDVYNLHPGTDNCKFEFPADNLPLATVGWSGSGVRERAYLCDVYSQAKLEPSTKPTPTIPQRSEDDIRHALAKIASDYSITEQTFLPWIPEIGDIAEAAKDGFDAQMFLDKFQAKCLEFSNARSGAPDYTPEQARELLSGRSTAPDHIETKEETPVSNDPDLQSLNAQTEKLSDWFPRESDNEERPAALTAGEQAVKDVEDMKAKRDENIIDGEIISEEPEPKRDGEETDFKLAAGKQVAEILNKAFPEATSTWKFQFYKEAVGYDGVGPAIDAIGPTKMFEKLNAGIAESKKVEGNLPKSENAPEKPPISNEAPSTPESAVSSNGGAPDKQSDQNSKALTTYNPKANSVATRSQPRFLMPTKDEFDYMKELAQAVGMSRFYKDVDSKEKALVIMMKGYVLGIDPVSALDGIYIINGRPFLSAKLLKALAEKTGSCERFEVIRESERCIVNVQRKGKSVTTITFTKQDALTAGLWDKDIWKKYPKDMLANRAVMRAVKSEWPEIDLGPMANEEEQEFVEEPTAA